MIQWQLTESFCLSEISNATSHSHQQLLYAFTAEHSAELMIRGLIIKVDNLRAAVGLA